jgi:hypothetical protein
MSLRLVRELAADGFPVAVAGQGRSTAARSARIQATAKVTTRRTGRSVRSSKPEDQAA